MTRKRMGQNKTKTNIQYYVIFKRFVNFSHIFESLQKIDTSEIFFLCTDVCLYLFYFILFYFRHMCESEVQSLN